MNPILRDAAKLMRSIREADQKTLIEARNVLKEFSDSWLITGSGDNLYGAGECSLADTDTANGVIEGLEIKIENL